MMSHAGPQLFAIRIRFPLTGAGSEVGPFQLEALAATRSPVAHGCAITPPLRAIDWTDWALASAVVLAEPLVLVVDPLPPQATTAASNANVDECMRARRSPPQFRSSDMQQTSPVTFICFLHHRMRTLRGSRSPGKPSYSSAWSGPSSSHRGHCAFIAAITERKMSRAMGAPMQKWMPAPNCSVLGRRVMSNRRGSWYTVVSNPVACWLMYTGMSFQIRSPANSVFSVAKRSLIVHGESI